MSLTAATIATIAASTARTSPGAVFWIVLASDRDGQTRGYSMREDGSRVTPLLPRDRALVPHAVSSDGGMISYDDGAGNGIYVSRANGKGIKRLARKTICFSKSVFMHDTVIGLFVNRYEFGIPI